MMKRILIVDDEKDLCELIRAQLTSKGYEVECAHCLNEAHLKWDKNNPSLVLLDNNLPDGVGLDMLEANLPLLKNTSIIMMTADTYFSNRQRAEKLGIMHFLQKPFTFGNLHELINQAI